MGKVSLILKARHRNFIIKKYKEIRITALNNKKLFENSKEPKNNLNFFKNIPRDSSLIRSRKFCSITGRMQGVYNIWGLCRHAVREFFKNGFLVNTLKSSW